MTLVVAHRGDPHGHIENTIAAIVSAARLGAHAVEVDVRCTTDGVPVLHHDPTLTRLWGHRAAVADLTRTQVRRHAPGIPTLREALAALRPHNVPLVLDLRDVRTARAAHRAAAEETNLLPGVPGVPGDGGAGTTAATRPGDRTWFCGHPRALAWVRHQDPGATVMLTWPLPIGPARRLIHLIRPTFLNPWHPWLDERTIHTCHATRTLVCAWTVDNPHRRRQLLRWGVDAIISTDVTTTLTDVTTTIADGVHVTGHLPSPARPLGLNG